MKRHLVPMFSLLTLFALPVAAQQSGAKDDAYHGGFTVFAGLTSFTADFTPAQSFTVQNASGFAAGIGYIAHLGGPIGLEFNAGYIQGGYAGTDGTTTATIHDNNVGGALLLRPAFGSGPVRFFLLGGASFAYLIDCSESETGVTAPACKVNSTENRTDYGLAIGGGVQYGMVAVQLRYDIGIANLSNTAGTTAKSKGLLILGSLIL